MYIYLYLSIYLYTYRLTAASHSQGEHARQRERVGGTPATASGALQRGAGASEASSERAAKAAQRKAYSFA